MGASRLYGRLLSIHWAILSRHPAVTGSRDISTPTTAYPPYGPALHWPIEIPAHHYEQYAGPPPPTTDPYAYRLAAPSMANHSNLVTCRTGLPVGRRDGTNTPTAPPFETSRTRVVGSQG
ncbi:hypothetical protein TESG_08263 [Trichophyton tonsurans CBS 112818]|uniref:Uncharacterized protein n=1 Tax=Trichophyton tonsurans (strain CBS 112818) TaxID=647933 RepID=F2RP20_TRIT1|nr:hypothetical protein TESG_08263 [Trichophyton tonsurans CBS 112818]